MHAPLVLLVDADPDSLSINALMLRHHGLRTARARGTAEGYRAALDLRPDLLVVEPFLAPAGGRTLLELLRGDPGTAGLRVIGLTSVATAPGLESCDRRLVKPCPPTRLLREVQFLLAAPAARPRAARVSALAG